MHKTSTHDGELAMRSDLRSNSFMFDQTHPEELPEISKIASRPYLNIPYFSKIVTQATNPNKHMMLHRKDSKPEERLLVAEYPSSH
jgi:hypothetical protein